MKSNFKREMRHVILICVANEIVNDELEKFSIECRQALYID